MYVDLKELEKRGEQGLIMARKHPFMDLTMYRYTTQCQYDRAWDEYTRMTRGLVADSNGKVYARPWPKFFNMGEPDCPPVPDEPFTVTEKLDGSLIQIFLKGPRAAVVTSSKSFQSWHQEEATRLIDEKYPDLWNKLEQGYTYLFELIHPDNQIVVNYDGERELYLLAVIDNETGIEQGLSQFDLTPLVPIHADYDDLSQLPERENAEGYVITFSSGLKMKVKHPNYVRIHKIISGMNEKAIWEMLSQGQDPRDHMEGVPDEIYAWVDQVAGSFNKQHKLLDRAISEEFLKVKRVVGPNAPMKEWAEEICKREEPTKTALFMKKKGKDYDEWMWKSIKPEPPYTKASI